MSSEKKVEDLREKLDKLESGLPSAVVEKIERRQFSEDEEEDLSKKIDRAKGAWASITLVFALVAVIVVDVVSHIVASLMSMPFSKALMCVLVFPALFLMSYVVQFFTDSED